MLRVADYCVLVQSHELINLPASTASISSYRILDRVRESFAPLGYVIIDVGGCDWSSQSLTVLKVSSAVVELKRISWAMTIGKTKGLSVMRVKLPTHDPFE